MQIFYIRLIVSDQNKILGTSLFYSKMGRDRSKIWSEFVKCTVNGRSGAQCIHCNVFYNFINATKMEFHISKCIKCPTNIKTKYLSKHIMKKKLSSSKSKSLINDDENEGWYSLFSFYAI